MILCFQCEDLLKIFLKYWAYYNILYHVALSGLKELRQYVLVDDFRISHHLSV